MRTPGKIALIAAAAVGATAALAVMLCMLPVFGLGGHTIGGLARGAVRSRVDPAKNRLFAEVIREIQEGRLTPNAGGDVALPAALAQASVDGRVFTSPISGNNTIVVFRTWVGKGGNMTGFLYVSVSLPEEALVADEQGEWILLQGARRWRLVERVSDHWFRVDWLLD